MEKVKQFCKSISRANRREEKELPEEKDVTDTGTKGHKPDCNAIRLQIGKNPWPGVP